MIRKLVREQLEKCSFANLNNYDPTTNTYTIPKYSKPVYEINKCYLVKLPLPIVGRNDSVLAINWNNGTSPSTECLKIFVSKTMGRMIYVDSIGYDFQNRTDLLNIMWSGWLDIEELTQLAVLY